MQLVFSVDVMESLQHRFYQLPTSLFIHIYYIDTQPIHPILERRSAVLLLLLLLLRHAQATPPGFLNRLDWRALVESRPPNIKKNLENSTFFANFFLVKFFFE